MAFVQPATSLRLSSFTPNNVDVKPRSSNVTHATTVRMAAPTTEEGAESPAVGVAGNSQWKENLFAGGFPGGEAFFRKWIDDGMTDDVPDMPKSMQPSSEYKPPRVPEKGGILGLLDTTEFFKDFGTVGKKAKSDTEKTDSSVDSPVDEMGSTISMPTTGIEGEDLSPSEILQTEIPDDTVYGKYFPSNIRFLAPTIDIQYNNSPYDRVGVSMNPVTASYTDAKYPKEMKNKAPFINISYSGSLSTACVRLSLDDVEPLPTLPPPPKASDTSVKLVKGSGGGLKLNFESSTGEKLL